MAELYLGLMSGTSADGIDAALVDFQPDIPALKATRSHPLPPELRHQLEATLAAGRCALDELAALDAGIGAAFAEAALALLRTADLPPAAVRAIGSHGQTLFHQPHGIHANSLQLGDANRIAECTGITTVADFRRRDMAAGGQGAPLVPGFHRAVFGGSGRHRVVVNIGGIANLTVLPADGQPVSGFDCGPGNTLMDAWARAHLGTPMDEDGRWAAGAEPDAALLRRMLKEPYFALPSPKSTGRELFNLSWLHAQDIAGLTPARVQASLCELTAVTVAEAVRRHAPGTEEVLVCGGGAYNSHLMNRLGRRLTGVALHTTAHAGWDPQWIEAAAFAWLARQTLTGAPGNVPSVTGAYRPVTLGAIYPGR